MANENLNDVSLQELQNRLVTYTHQLESIHELLQADPENMEYLTIATDLMEVIKLTKEMIDLKMKPHSSTEPSDKVNVTPAPAKPLSPASSSEHVDTKQRELAFAPGSYVEALFQSTWYPAYIESITENDMYNVKYLGFGSKDELKESMLRGIDIDDEAYSHADDITVGLKCEAKYYVDGQYYPCTVTEQTPLGYQVLFDGYGNSEEVPLEYLRRSLNKPNQEYSAQRHALPAKANKPTGNSDKPIKIPENLQILPTDTEAEKERKRKRIRAIKSLNRQKMMENERNSKQQDWKAFQNKALKKKFKGASGVLTKRGTSIFASPETVDGRVGVVGSGQGMTSFVDTRKKHKRADGTSLPLP